MRRYLISEKCKHFWTAPPLSSSTTITRNVLKECFLGGECGEKEEKRKGKK